MECSKHHNWWNDKEKYPFIIFSFPPKKWFHLPHSPLTLGLLFQLDRVILLHACCPPYQFTLPPLQYKTCTDYPFKFHVLYILCCDPLKANYGEQHHILKKTSCCKNRKWTLWIILGFSIWPCCVFLLGACSTTFKT